MQFQVFVEDEVFSPTARRRGRSAPPRRKSPARSASGRTRSRVPHGSGRARTQVRLRQMLEILNRVEAATGSTLAAYAWFRAEPLPGFGGATPDKLLREGRAEDVHAYLDRIVAGGYA